MGTMVKKWSDETVGASYIEHLTFPSDRYWTSGTITVYGTKWRQKVDLKVTMGDEKITFHCEPDEKKTSVRNFTINARCAVNVTGKLYPIVPGIQCAGAVVTVTLNYRDEPVLRSKSVTWSDETGGVSCIEKLFLPASEKWTHCEVKVQGRSDKITGCHIAVIVNGEIFGGGHWCVLTGSESKVFPFTGINGRHTILVAGYISNNKGIGAGAKVTLTGYYN